MNLLVLPSLFPQYEDDISGIFVMDYMKSVEKYFNISVLDMKIAGENKGLIVEDRGNIKVFHYAISNKTVNKTLKKFLYLKWFHDGYKLGTRMKNLDIIHAHGSTLCGTLGLLISRRLKVPIVITEHSGPFSKHMGSMKSRVLTKYSLESADAVLTVSEDLKKQILNYSILPKKIIVTYNPVDVDMFHLQGKSDPFSEKKIIYVGRLEDYKGIVRVVEAFRGIARVHPDWHLTIIGDGPEYERVHRMINEDRILLGRVIMKGQMRKESIANEMRKSSFFVFPSEHETFGIVIAEAMATGLPVIVGNETAPKEFVDEEAGLLVSPRDTAAIENAMEYLINNLAKYDPQRIREKIVSRFGFDAFGQNLNAIYKEFI